MAILQPLRLAIKPAQPLAAAIGRAAWDGRAPIGKAKAVNGADAVVLLRGKTNMGNLIALLTGRESRGLHAGLNGATEAVLRRIGTGQRGQLS